MFENNKKSPHSKKKELPCYPVIDCSKLLYQKSNTHQVRSKTMFEKSMHGSLPIDICILYLAPQWECVYTVMLAKQLNLNGTHNPAGMQKPLEESRQQTIIKRVRTHNILVENHANEQVYSHKVFYTYSTG
jgi:hypothetical protein